MSNIKKQTVLDIKSVNYVLNYLQGIKYDSNDSVWRFRSPNKLEHDKIGNCHDQASYIYHKLSQAGFICGRIFMMEYADGDPVGGATHTACYCKDGNNYYWIENAWKEKCGIHGPYSTLDELYRDLVSNWGFYGKYDRIFTSQIGRVRYGVTLKEYVDSCIGMPGCRIYGKDIEIIKESIINNSFSEIKAIVDKIPKSEHHFFYQGDVFKDSQYIIYRDINYTTGRDGKKHGCFIEVYSYPENPNIGIVVIVCEPEVRGLGITDTLVRKLKQHMKKLNLTELIWRADIDNFASQKLAKRCGFKVSKKHIDQIVYLYSIKS